MTKIVSIEDETLKCSACTEKLGGEVVKLLPDCGGESICGSCYERLREEVAEWGSYQCPLCAERHSMPDNGLPDNKIVLKVLAQTEIGKREKELKGLVEALRSEADRLKALTIDDAIVDHCNELASQVNKAIETAKNNLDVIQAELLAQIAQYKSARLKDRQAFDSDKDKYHQDLKEFVKDTDEFTSKWIDYFGKGDMTANDVVIDVALKDVKAIQTKFKAFREELKKIAFKDQELVLDAKRSFLDDVDYLRMIFKLSIKSKKNEVIIHPSSVKTLAGHTETVFQAIFLPEHRLASCSKDQTIKVWSLKDGKQFELKGHIGHVLCITLLRNGWLASGSFDDTIKLWNLNKKKAEKTLVGHFNIVVSIKQMENGHLASLSTDNTIMIWDVNAKKKELVRTIRGHENRSLIMPLAFTSEQHLITCSSGRKSDIECVLKVWDPTDGKLLKSLCTGLDTAWSILVLADGQVSLGFKNGSIMIIDPSVGDIAKTKKRAHLGYVTALVQLKSGHLVSAGYDGETNASDLKVWTLPEFKLSQLIVTQHKGHICSLSVSSDERLLASSSRDSTVKLWRLS